MKLSLRFLYLLPLLGILVTDRAFTEFIFPDESSPALHLFGRLVLAGSLGIVGFCYQNMSATMQRWLLLVVAAIGALAIESYAGWQTWAVYPHVFAKLLAIMHVFAIYGFHRRFGLPPFGQLMGLLLLVLATNLVLYHRDALSLSAFLDNERGFSSTSAMLLLLPTLYYFNQYMAHGGLARLLIFFLGAALIFFLQHRSVWVSMGVALALNALMLALGRVAGARLGSARLLPMVLIPLFVLVSGGLVVLSDPPVVKKLAGSLNDILRPSQQGTGSWRLKQFEAYRPYLAEYPIAGMRLKGFELPVQFYTLADDGGSQVPVWEDRTGHHFHSFYFDRLFYFGIAGLLLTGLVPVLLLGRRLLSRLPMAPPTAAFVIFSLSSLVYSISYDWPLYFFGVLGLSLAAAAAPVRVAAHLPAEAPAARPAFVSFSSLSHANAAPSTTHR